MPPDPDTLPQLSPIRDDPVSMAYAAAGVGHDESLDALDDDRRIDLYMALRLEQNRSQGEADELKQRADALHEDIVDYMTESQTQKITRQGATLYLHTDHWPVVRGDKDDKAAAKAELIQRLKADPETAHMIAENFHAQTLRSWLRHEHTSDAGEVEVPERFADLLGVSAVTKAKVTTARR